MRGATRWCSCTTPTAPKIRADGLEITREPAPIESLGCAVVGLAKDPDGYVIELIEAPAARQAAAAADSVSA